MTRTIDIAYSLLTIISSVRQTSISYSSLVIIDNQVLLVIERFGLCFDSHLVKAKQGLQWLFWSIGLTMGIFLHIMSAYHLDVRIGNPYTTYRAAIMTSLIRCAS